jgi:hypothetical protein
MYMLVRYTDEEETAIAAVILVSNSIQRLRSRLEQRRPDVAWSESGARAVAWGTNEAPNELVCFGILHVNEA